MLKAKGEDIAPVLKEVDGLKAKMQDAEGKMKALEEQVWLPSFNLVALDPGSYVGPKHQIL
eukprot:1442874-Rhodomonas_salina.4